MIIEPVWSVPFMWSSFSEKISENFSSISGVGCKLVLEFVEELIFILLLNFLTNKNYKLLSCIVQAFKMNRVQQTEFWRWCCNEFSRFYIICSDQRRISPSNGGHQKYSLHDLKTQTAIRGCLNHRRPLVGVRFACSRRFTASAILLPANLMCHDDISINFGFTVGCPNS